MLRESCIAGVNLTWLLVFVLGKWASKVQYSKKLDSRLPPNFRTHIKIISNPSDPVARWEGGDWRNLASQLAGQMQRWTRRPCLIKEGRED